ncbi:ATP-binding protein [Rhizobium rhizogenes]|uniref:ATP-binding protein n=1 Tax=Rhizobium rhizogenes TaxID=359 RepID=UPI0015722A7D|nr:ATP-binding protein [Rhizobium rhizogenes]NTI36112.1 hypothetical protein [Rhizobium rhizogenes]WEO64069.1 ATP-binding protein [Rhizobium rhizogenes]
MSLDYDIASPGEGVLFEFLRAYGCDLSTALADTVDNSITAGVCNVWIDMQWAGRASRIVIRSDGQSISEDELGQTTRPGRRGALASRKADDLGRFGFAMKTAFTSHCHCSIFLSEALQSSPTRRRWHLDRIGAPRTGECRLLTRMDLRLKADLAAEHKRIRSGLAAIT